jgi:hypothetical protein
MASVAKGPEKDSLTSNALGSYKASEFKMPSFSMPSMPSSDSYKTVEDSAASAESPTENIADASAFQVNTQDIAKAPEVSLFQVISTRYWKTGFNLLLEKEAPLK